MYMPTVSRLPGVRRTLLFVAMGLAAVASAQGEPSPTPPSPPPQPESSEPRVVIHGYLAQAFAISSGYQVLGIPKDGTFDYRTAALQVRATMTPKDSFVIQLSQERLGESPVMAVRNEIDLDWVFYERELGAGTSLRAGKVRIPFGVYNEIRLVGPLLPFFRPADAFYGEGSYVVSSINGAVLSKSLFAAHRFGLDADLYGGEWSFLQADRATRAHAKKGLGGQLWLNTPLRGLRFGLAGHRSTWSNSIDAPPGAKVRHNRWAASVDGSFEPFRLSAEYAEDTFAGAEAAASYALVSWHVTEKLSLNLQASQAHLTLGEAGFDEQLSRDYAAGLSFAFRPDLVAKVENHWARGRQFEEPGVTIFAPPLTTNYLIISLSTLF